MKSRLIFIFSIGLLMFSCNKDDDMRTGTLLLTDFERSIIPFQEETNLDFISNEEIVQESSVSPIDVRMYFQPSDEISYNIEGAYNAYFFDEINLTLEAWVLRKSRGTSFNINAKRDGPVPDILDLEPCVRFPSNENGLPNYLTDITVKGKTFTNVFVFSNCSELGNSMVERIVYSIERGVEFIEFQDGSYLFQD